jgi:hypothetical protein
MPLADECMYPSFDGIMVTAVEWRFLTVAPL